MLKDHPGPNEPVWPYIGVVCCLFVLSIFAARSWHDSRDSTPISRTPPSRRPQRATVYFAADSWVEPHGGFASRTFTRPVLRHRELVSPSTDAEWESLEQQTPMERAPEFSGLNAAEIESTQLVQTPLEPVLELRGPTLDSAAAIDDSPLSDQASALPKQAEFAPPVAELIRVESRPLVEVIEPSEAVAIKNDTAADPIAATPAEVESDWPAPVAIEDLLASMQSMNHCSDWVNRVATAFSQIRQSADLSSREASDALGKLKRLANEGRALAGSATAQEVRSDLLRASYAIQRRRLLWKRVHEIAANPNHGLVTVGLHDLELSLDEVDKHLGSSSVADGWRDYLRLSELRDANQYGDATTQREIARLTLERLKRNAMLSAAQRDYLEKPPFTDLIVGLSRWAREPIDYTKLLSVVEKYENRSNTALAAELARFSRVARWSDDQEVSEMADTIETHYRNANLRVAVNVALINRLLPQPKAVTEEVDEYILGAYVNGTSETSSKLKVVLEPDERLWRMRLEAEGSVASHTAASKGPATFYNDGYSEFQARKTLLVDDQGVKVEMAEAEAASESELTGFETQFDPVPVVGFLARAIARQQHDGRLGDARVATEAKLEERARERLDEEVHARLKEIESDFRTRILLPFTALELRPKAIDMHTTDDRLVIRYRLAGLEQLGAHTARPQAPSNSLLSVQIHETVLNNIISQLELEGSSGNLAALYSRIGGRFQRDLKAPADLPNDVTIRFAKRDALRVRFEDGKVVLTARIAELANPRHSWRNFAVRVYYVPDPTQKDANLIREGVVELAGPRLRLGDQIALRGIFAKVFSKNSPVKVINQRLERHPQMSNLQVSQFTIADGWIGVALAPAPAAATTPTMARRRIIDSRR